MRLIFSFTTTPTRIHKIEPMINSLLQQKRKADLIILNLPNEYIRDKATLVIPDFIKNNNLIIINRCKDYGPATKLVGILNNNSKYSLNDNDHIITVDDDINYQNNLLEVYEKFIKLTKNNVYGLSGLNFNVNGSMNWIRENNIIKRVDCLEGYASICYPFKFLRKDILTELSVAPKYLLFSDDVLISNYFNKKTRLILINTPKLNLWRNTTLSYGDEKDALHNQKGVSTHFLNYKNSVNHLKKNKNLNMENGIKQEILKIILRNLNYNRRNNYRWRKKKA